MNDRTKKAADLQPDDLVVRWPDAYNIDLLDRLGEWTVVDPICADPWDPKPVSPDGMTRVFYVDGRGLAGQWQLNKDADVTVRTDPRRELVAGLRELASVLESTEEVPVDQWTGAAVAHSLDVSAAEDPIAEIDRIAKALGVEATRDGVYHRVTARFGPIKYDVSAYLPERAKEATS